MYVQFLKDDNLEACAFACSCFWSLFQTSKLLTSCFYIAHFHLPIMFRDLTIAPPSKWNQMKRMRLFRSFKSTEIDLYSALSFLWKGPHKCIFRNRCPPIVYDFVFLEKHKTLRYGCAASDLCLDFNIPSLQPKVLKTVYLRHCCALSFLQTRG